MAGGGGRAGGLGKQRGAPAVPAPGDDLDHLEEQEAGEPEEGTLVVVALYRKNNKLGVACYQEAESLLHLCQLQGERVGITLTGSMKLEALSV